ncbi:homoserine dehydrogenase [Amphibiibacter pelophylacis]|uniref:Homoserine dehydrogenase n=1 Tax=Amphibiibacter pelophylacis TaxID=1799477 RepID=A0ACC6NZ61_9BURK
MIPLRIGVMGLGTVGAGVFQVLERNSGEIARRTGRGLQVTQVSRRNLDAARELVGDRATVVADPHAIATSPDIDVVVELIGGTTLARDLVLLALRHGKHVVTANKALLAVHGEEIFGEARRLGLTVSFEAAVAGGIPVIKMLREGLSANRISWLAGIINGTTNFILTEMRDRGLPFADVLQEAQRLGYAEADPTFDIEGVDAAHKLALMGAIAFGMPVQFDSVYVEGITALHSQDIRYAGQMGYRIKLLGIARRRDDAGGVELRVHPTLVPEKCLMASVEGAMNAVMVQGDAVGTTLHYGKGAGSEPTASAVVADLVDIARLASAAPEHRVPSLSFQPDALQNLRVLSIDEVVTAFYLRLVVADRSGVLADITRILAAHDISLDAVRQRESSHGEQQTDLVVLTHETIESALRAALKDIQALPSVLQPVVALRKEELA